MITILSLGVDIGQKQDPTAICVAELDHGSPPRATVRHLERLALGTPYPQVAQRVRELVRGLRQRAGQDPALYIDATGVGAPVVDLIHSPEEQILPIAVTFVRGHAHRKKTSHKLSLGKAAMVSQLQAMVGSGRLHLPSTEEARALARELRNYEIRVGSNANARYGAFRSGTHDDLVTALGLSIQPIATPLDADLRHGRRENPFKTLKTLETQGL